MLELRSNMISTQTSNSDGDYSDEGVHVKTFQIVEHYCTKQKGVVFCYPGTETIPNTPKLDYLLSIKEELVYCFLISAIVFIVYLVYRGLTKDAKEVNKIKMYQAETERIEVENSIQIDKD